MIVNLEATTSLAITLNTTHHTFSFHKDKMIQPSKIFDVNLDDFRKLLLNPVIEYPSHVYTEYRDVYSKNSLELFKGMGVRHNIIYIPNSMLGIEFNKTHIYTSKHVGLKKNSTLKSITTNKSKTTIQFACILECLNGSCAVLLQNRKLPEDYIDQNLKDPEIYESGIVKLKKGERVPIPTGYDFIIINLKSSPCLVSKFYKQDFILNYKLYNSCKGFAYYVIRKNGRVEIVPNSHYRDVPKLRSIRIKDFVKDYGFDYKSSTYKQAITNSEFISSHLKDFTKDE